MTNERLEEIAARVDAATPGPWFAAASSVHSEPLSREYDRIERDIPEYALDEAYAALPNSCVATVPVVSGDTPTARGAADAAFIANARDDIPALIAEVRRLRGLVERVAGIKDQRPKLARWIADCEAAIDACREAVEEAVAISYRPASSTKKKQR